LREKERQKRDRITSVGGGIRDDKGNKKKTKQQIPVAGVKFYNLGRRKRV
jgi:hypothetical protein